MFLSRMGPTYTHHSKHNARIQLVSPGQKELELEWLEVFRKGWDENLGPMGITLEPKWPLYFWGSKKHFKKACIF